jgi:hypothetical protein
VVLSAALMLAGMWVAVRVMEVCFVGDAWRTCYKLIAVAVFPARSTASAPTPAARRTGRCSARS